ncbi:methyltransferase family protein [Mycolicibacterium vinylchloridicum]|uniref:methyltransferase family protein n=1 Tax=Mycolicibacterium vinylchloridicum TaxID=2736928 RepID=UPI0015C767DE|nr:isoprenylcysteine carboxylmethyltransferase family protein [Mycolicibacterium vinylchloridicum]
MPTIALILFTVFAALGFGWRSRDQHRRMGSTGFKGISGQLGSVEWLAGVGLVVALIAAVAAPLLQLAGVVAPVPALVATWIQLTGIVFAVAGTAMTVWAQLDMGDSWRIGVDEGETTTLVRSGLFGRVRNPIFAAMLLFGLGLTLVTPNIVALIAFALLAVSIEVQVRLVEEPYLLRVHGQSYLDYVATVGRFVPHVGLRR